MLAIPFISPLLYILLHALSLKRVKKETRFKYRLLVQLCTGSWLILLTSLICWMAFEDVYDWQAFCFVAAVSLLWNMTYLFYALASELTPKKSEENLDLRVHLSEQLDHLVSIGIIQEKEDGIQLAQTSLKTLSRFVLFLRGSNQIAKSQQHQESTHIK